MTGLLLTIHILAAILTLGPVTVAASMFAPAARMALTGDKSADGPGQLAMLHRICRVYGAAAVLVPAAGLVIAARLRVFGEAWLITAIALTAVAAVILIGVILPGQGHVLAGLAAHQPLRTDAAEPVDGQRTVLVNEANQPSLPAAGLRHLNRQVITRLGLATGGFNLLWVAVVVLMVVRPGTGTGD